MHIASVRLRDELAEEPDEALVGFARGGDEAAIRLLIKRNNQRLFRVARGVVRNDAEAEDVVQATYVKAFSKLDSFRGDAKVSTWLTRIALNEALGRVRRRRPTTGLEEIDVVASSHTGLVVPFPTSLAPAPADIEIDRKQVRKILEHAIDDLPEIFRLVFILRDVEGMSVEDTASQLELKPETVKTRLHRGRKLMRAAIEKRLAATFSDLFPFDGARCETMADRVVNLLRAG